MQIVCGTQRSIISYILHLKILRLVHGSPLRKLWQDVYLMTIFTLSKVQCSCPYYKIRRMPRQRHAYRTFFLTLFPRGKLSTIVLIKIGNLKTRCLGIVNHCKQINGVFTNIKVFEILIGFFFFAYTVFRLLQ